ncbi:MAG: hypothetical protein ACRDYC_07155 [Acidimicrobiales bacterium]
MKPRPLPRPPPHEVLEAWGVSTVAQLPGGKGTVYGTDALVFKPVDDRQEVEWLSRTLQALPHFSTLRLIRPAPSLDGAWVVAGWSAWERLVGTEAPGRWREVLEVSDRFHAQVANVAWSESIGRQHPWALGDAFAWGEYELSIPAVLGAPVNELIRRRVPIDLPRQLVHGDLCGNVLFEEGLPPAVIDISPLWRPKRFADAIIVVDSMMWHGAGEDALEGFVDPIGDQMLVRALLFRLAAASIIFDGYDARLQKELVGYEPILRAIDL